MNRTPLVQELDEALPRPAAANGLLAWIASVDHKQLGIMYILTALFFLVVGGVEALMIRVQLAIPENTLLSPEMYNQLFTMHGTTMIFLVAMPIIFGIGVYMIPLMIGARDMAFPRLNAFSFWLVVFGGIMLHISFVTGGAPNAGWFSYVPLSERAFNIQPGLDYWALGLLGLGVGSVATGLNVIVTVVHYRAPGMSFKRLPLFVWMMLVTSALMLGALPALNACAVMLLFDRLLDARFFMPAYGGHALIWQHYFWFFGHPEVYILVLPAFGIISEVIPVFSRKPIYGYPFVVGSAIAIGMIGFGVWAHHMFAVGLGLGATYFFVLGTMLIAIPTGVKIFNWLATMWGGTIHFTTAMLFATAFLLQFVIGGLSGIMFAAAPIDQQLTDTYFVVAHFHYVIIGGILFALFAGAYYWFPKISGRMLSERIGKWQFWLTFIGFNMTFFVQHILGILGMPRRVYTYQANPGWMALNMISTIGAFILGLGILLLVYNMLVSARNGKVAGDNPWAAWSLEWLTHSPPPPQDFERVPPIRSRRPLWDLAHPDDPDWKRREQG